MKEMPYHPWVILSPEEYFNPTRTVDGRGIDADWADKITLETHLTGVECAAEYWHSAYYALVPIVQSLLGELTITPEIDTATRRQAEEAMIWYRFSTHPHARETNYE